MHALLHSVPTTLQQATIDSCLRQRLLDTQGQVWVSLFWGHCSFLLGPGVYKALFVPSKSLFPQSCESSGGYGDVNGNLHEGLCYTQVCCTQLKSASPSHTHACCTYSPCLCGSPLLTHTSSGDTQTQFCLSLCGVSGSWCTQVLFWAPFVSLAGMGFDSKCDFAPLTILLGLLLCPWMRGISLKLLQHREAAVPVPTILPGLFCPWT